MDLKVGLVTTEYPPFNYGGIPQVANDLAENLSKKHIDITVFCGKPRKITVEKMKTNPKIVRFPVIDLPPRNLWFQIQNKTSITSLIKGFDIIHYVEPRLGVLAHFGKKTKTPIVTHLHGSAYGETKVFLASPISSWTPGDFVYEVLEYPIFESLTRLCLRNSDHFIICSFDRLNELKRRNPKIPVSKTTVIYNGIDFQKIDTNNDYPEEKNKSILFWGRLYYNKGIIQLIKAMAIVKQTHPNIHLDVCGKGQMETKLRALTHKLSLENNITFQGYTKPEDLIRRIQEATLIVLPSLYEGQPMAALEAMAYKKTVLMFDFPFVREYIRDWDTGLIAKAGDINDLALRINAALSDKKLRHKIGANAYEQVKKNHNWETLIYKYINLYNQLAQQP